MVCPFVLRPQSSQNFAKERRSSSVEIFIFSPVHSLKCEAHTHTPEGQVGQLMISHVADTDLNSKATCK